MLDSVFSKLYILCVSTRARLLLFLKTGGLACFNLLSLFCLFSIHLLIIDYPIRYHVSLGKVTGSIRK